MRKQSLLRALPVAVVLSAASLLSCAPGDSPTASPGDVHLERAHGRPASPGRPVASLPVEPVVVSSIIDRRGGELKAGGHVLSVEGGAVNVPTRFTLRVVDDGYVHVDLTAEEADETGEFTRNVGARGFRKPVTLKMDYSAALTTGNERLMVSWLQDGRLDGRLVPQPSRVDTHNRWVIARLAHFSGYILSGN